MRVCRKLGDLVAPAPSAEPLALVQVALSASAKTDWPMMVMTTRMAMNTTMMREILAKTGTLHTAAKVAMDMTCTGQRKSSKATLRGTRSVVTATRKTSMTTSRTVRVRVVRRVKIYWVRICTTFRLTTK